MTEHGQPARPEELRWTISRTTGHDMIDGPYIDRIEVAPANLLWDPWEGGSAMTQSDLDALYRAKMLGLLEALFTNHSEPESPEAARAVGRAINVAQHHLVQLERRAGIDGNV